MAIVAWAEQHLFERRSVVQDYELVSAALARGRGNELTLSDLNLHIGNGGYVRAPARASSPRARCWTANWKSSWPRTTAGGVTPR
ncbi:MAG: hypothetical protein WC205_11395 [Opitutaceae bacterium]|jgi:hypothetical protein